MGASESTIRSRLQDKPLVVICGGGFAGTALAGQLDKQYNVILIDRKNYIFHNIGALRASTQPDFLKNIAIPYTNILKFGSVIQAEIQSISPDGVVVNGRPEPIPFNYCVIATGSSYSFPAKVGSPLASELPAMYDDIATNIRESQKPLIIGGGPVGLELLGEIMTVYPDKQLTLVHSREHVLTDFFADAFRTQIEARIADAFPNAKLVLGARAQLDDDMAEQTRMRYFRGERSIQLSNGEAVDADLILFCGGAKINSRSYEETFANNLNDQKQLNVNEYLQVDGYQNIFAIGDCCSASANFGWIASEHAKIVAANIGKLQADQPDQMTAVGEYPRIALIPLGINEGCSQLPFGIVGRRVTGMLKGSDLLTKMYWKSCGFKGLPTEMMGGVAEESKEADADPNAQERITRMSVVAKMSEEDMQELLKGYEVPEPEATQTFS